MRKYLLPEGGKFYKVNMHSHTTLSDGRQTPEEVKQAYKDKGYAAVAFTEHTHIHDVTHLTDDEFIAITSYEVAFADQQNVPFCFYEGAPHGFSHIEAVHLNLYAKDPHNTKEIDLKSIKEKYGEFTVETFNETIRQAKEQGFLVCYNHPNWSLNTYPLYSKLRGLDAIEINNGASHRSSDNDYAPSVYDQMARAGIRMSAYAGDDNHGTVHFFKAWTMVKAPELSYGALMDALEKGDCYASDGPEIYELYVEDDTVTVKCSDACGIFYTSGGRAKQCKLDETYENPVSSATFKLNPEDYCFRITVRDARGHHANTRIYYLDEIGM